MIKVKMTSKLWNYVKEHEGYIFNLWPKELRDEMNEIICDVDRGAIETFWSNGRDYERGWWGRPEHYSYCIGCEAYRFSSEVEPEFIDYSIKYVVGIYLTNLSDTYKKALSNF